MFGKKSDALTRSKKAAGRPNDVNALPELEGIESTGKRINRVAFIEGACTIQPADSSPPDCGQVLGIAPNE